MGKHFCVNCGWLHKKYVQIKVKSTSLRENYMFPKVIDNAYATAIGFAIAGWLLISHEGNITAAALGTILILTAIALAIFRLYIDNQNAESNRRWQSFGDKI